jgi:Xaa-Pro aminopeptidase
VNETEPQRIGDAAQPKPGPVLTLRERDRRWSGLQALMRGRGLAAIIVGSFQGRERLETYLIDDFLDSIVILPNVGDAILLTFSPGRTSRMLESARRGYEPWVKDVRMGGGGAKTGEILAELGLSEARIGIVGMGPTAPGEMEGVLPVGFYANLTGKLPDAIFEDFTHDMTDFMLVKSDEELVLLRFAAQVSERAGAVMIETAKPGVSEALVYAEIMREIHRWGCTTRYPFLTLQSGPDNLGWGAPRWTLRGEPPRILTNGDLVQAEIHTMYGAQESQVQMSVALGPVNEEIKFCADVAHRAYEEGVAAVRPGTTFGEVFAAMEAPIRDAKCWSKTPLLHTLTFGANAFTGVNREQIAGTEEEWIEGQAQFGARRSDMRLREGMTLELEPNACLKQTRVNIGGVVLVTASGCEELNTLSTRIHYS